MSDDSKNLSRVEDILSGEDYIPTKPMSRIEKLLLEGGGPGGKLPEVTSDDNGKILKVKDGAWDKGEDISGDKLPQVSSSDNGKVLKVVQGEWNIDKDEGDRLPTVTSADEGKVLKVKNGAWDKDVPEKELPETTSEDSGKALMINDNGDWAKSDIPDPAITAEASGNIASFSDGSNLPMPSLKVGIEPVQDLHGYDSPWVGGAGKNLFNKPNTVINKAIPQGTVIYGQIFGVTVGFKLYGYDENDNEYEVMALSINKNSTTTTRAYTRLEISQSALDVLGDGNLMVSLSDFTQFEPYSNICPISGWDECKVTRCGVNVWDEEWEVGNINDGSGEDLPQDNVIRSKGYIRVMSGASYYIKCPTSGISRLFLYTKDKSYITYVPLDNIINNIYTVPNNCEYIRFRTLAAYGITYNNDISINYPSTDTEYHAYNGQTYTIDLDGTRYGGTLDVVSGVLTVDRVAVSLGDINYTKSQSGLFQTNEIANNVKKSSYSYTPTGFIKSSHFREIDSASITGPQGSNPSPDGVMAVSSSGIFYINYWAVTDVTDFKTAMASATLVYELATPITYQLTPTEVKSLLGSNNVWADTGEIESLIYYKQNAEDIADLIETLVPEELPAITSADNDKILTAYGGEWVPKTNPLPDARNYEAGSVLTVRNNHWNPELLPATPGVPRVESDDVGKVLKATGVDTYDWANGTDIIQTTQDSYDAMSDSQKMNGKLYFVHNESDDEEAAIYFMNKCYGKAPSGSKAVYLPLADYEELTTAEKEDPTKIYFVINEGTKVSPVLSGADSRISQSSQLDDPSGGWKAFDGVKDTDNHIEHSWRPWGNNGGEWISCSFDSAQNFSKIVIDAMVNMNTGASNMFTYWVEGSNDGETWDNILLNGETISITYNGRGYTNWKEDTILLNCPKKYNKIRLRMDKSIGYQYSYCGYWLTEFEIYAAAASNKPSIYYKNVLYNPDELPATTISDAGKVLKVNEDGLWDKGDAPIPDINAVQVPPVIFDNGSLKKINDMNEFPGLEKVFLTPTSYEALTQAEKEDLSKIYYVSLYEFFSSNDGTVVIRLNGDKTERLCFFNGFIDNFNSVTPYANFPEELRDVWTTYSNAPGNVASTEYDENGDIRSGRYFGFRSVSDWHVNDMDGAWNNYGPKNRANYAVIDMTSSTALQSNPWADPYDIPNGMTIYYGGKQYSEYEPAKPYVELTQAEYDALPSSKESDGMIHFITDAGKIILNGIQYG